jgi:hypothetical protein
MLAENSTRLYSPWNYFSIEGFLIINTNNNYPHSSQMRLGAVQLRS